MKKNFLRTIRKQKNMTLQELADAVGTSNQQVSNHEAGKRKLTWEWIKRYSAALECHPLDITEGPGVDHGPKNAEEKELLDLFRQMKDKDQDRLIGYMESKIEGDEKKR